MIYCAGGECMCACSEDRDRCVCVFFFPLHCTESYNFYQNHKLNNRKMVKNNTAGGSRTIDV